MLNGLILGESLLNDAVAIVLCGSIEAYSKLSLTQGEAVEPQVLLLTVLRFFSILIGSVGLGALIGAMTALMTKFTHIKDFPLLETSLFFLMSYCCYLLAEICEMSGIVSVLFCGIFQAHYTYRNLSPESQIRTKQFSETLNFLSENFIFCYLGVSMFTFAHHYFSFIFIFGTFVAIAIARAANIYPLSLLLNVGRCQKIPMKVCTEQNLQKLMLIKAFLMQYQHMLWFAGLRGAMAFALALRNTVTEVRQLFFTTTCVITITTVIINGGMTVPVLTFLQVFAKFQIGKACSSYFLQVQSKVLTKFLSFQIPVGTQEDEREELLQRADSTDSSLSITNSVSNSKRRSWLARVWRSFDSKLMKPLLTSARPGLGETLPDCCAPLGHWLTSDEQMGLSMPLTDQDGQAFDLEAVGGSLSSGD